jgi:hypothetical protein
MIMEIPKITIGWLLVVFLFFFYFGVQRHFQQYFNYIVTFTLIGENRSPRRKPQLLFLLYINDITDNLGNLARLFADDRHFTILLR